MRTLISLLTAAAALGACASSGSTPPPELRNSGLVGQPTSSSASIVNTTVAFPIDQVWLALPGVYASLGIPVQMLDAKNHQMGNEGFKTRKQLGTTPLSRYIECGTTQIGPNADAYDVVLTLLTQLQPGVGGATNVTTTFEGSAKPVTYSQDYSRCSSKGLLEARLNDSLVARLRPR